MPSKKQIDIESILIQLTLYKEELKEINELEDKLNQEKFLINEYLNKTFVLLDNILANMTRKNYQINYQKKYYENKIKKRSKKKITNLIVSIENTKKIMLENIIYEIVIKF